MAIWKHKEHTVYLNIFNGLIIWRSIAWSHFEEGAVKSSDVASTLLPWQIRSHSARLQHSWELFAKVRKREWATILLMHQKWHCTDICVHISFCSTDFPQKLKISTQEKFWLQRSGGSEQRQGYINRGTCSYPEPTSCHVLTSAYVTIFWAVARNAVNKSVWRKKTVLDFPSTNMLWISLFKHQQM